MKLALEANAQQLAAVQQSLAEIKNGLPQALTAAINKTLPKVRTLEARAVGEVLNLPYRDILHTMSVRKATRSGLSGSVYCRRQPVPLIKYGAKQTPKGVSVTVRRDKGAEELAGWFVATMPNGHKGVFARDPAGKRKTIVKETAVNGRVALRKQSTELPIREKYGPTAVGVLAGKPGLIDQIAEQASASLAVNLDSQVERLLAK